MSDIHTSDSPRKTIATAQKLCHRFYLYFPRKDLSYYVSPVHLNAGAVRLPATQDATLAALYASAKMGNTLKKPPDILTVSYAVRFPELAAKSKAIGGDVSMGPEVPFGAFSCASTHRIH